VDVEHRLELLVAHPVDDAVPGVARVVDEDVHGAERVRRGRHQLVRHALLGEVTREDRRLAVDLGGRLLGDVAVEVVDQHLGALAHEQLRRRAANPARRAGHDRALSVKQSHRVSSPRRCLSAGFPRGKAIRRAADWPVRPRTARILFRTASTAPVPCSNDRNGPPE
jgi:hypothetical protein